MLEDKSDPDKEEEKAFMKTAKMKCICGRWKTGRKVSGGIVYPMTCGKCGSTQKDIERDRIRHILG